MPFKNEQKKVGFTLFFGTYENKLDKKGRVSIPANFRPYLSHADFSGVLAFKSFRYNCIEACNYKFMEKIKENMGSYDLFSENHDYITTSIFGEAQPLNIDSDGRITLPKDFIDHSQITDKAAFIGVGDLFQIWSPSILLDHKAKCRKQIKNKGLTLPQSSIKHKGEA